MSNIDREANEWVAKLDRTDWSSDDERDLQAWLARGSRHKGAFLQAQSTWLMFDQLSQDTDKAIEPAAPARRVSRRYMLALGGATAVAASIAGGVLLLNHGEVVQTGKGEMRRVPLEDGSLAAINTSSEIDIAFTDAARVVRMNRGEAWFSVAKNPARPFIVEAGSARVQAVGTAFSVYRREAGIDVIVTEGVVQVFAGGDATLRLSQGEKAFVRYDATPPSVEREVAVERELAWRTGHIELSNDRLSEAISQFNRYNRRRIVLADPGLADRRLDGIFSTDDPVGFAKAVGFSLGAKVTIGAEAVRIG